ncbi:hypothetical protein V6E05_00960 [Citrobacter freundii]|uniref:hypothetical protein n=1 Tax=Citrobacter freundii TaxID=546 RepID=UPI002FD8C4C6
MSKLTREVITALACTNDDIHPDNSTKMCAAWSACRAAMLQGKAPQQLGGPSGVHAKVNNGHHVGAGDGSYGRAGDGSYGRAGDDLSARGMGGTGCDNTAPQPENESE